MMRARIVAVALLAAIGGTLPAGAQETPTDPSKFPTSHWFSIGADFLTSHPRGDLKQNAGTGFGFGGNGLFAADKWGIAGLRVDLGMVRYGMERKRYRCGSFCFYEATTTNDIINLQVGGQLVMPGNLVLPYVGASYGTLWFTSNSKVETEDGTTSPFRHDVSSSDATASYMFAGGFYFPLGGALRGLTANLGMRLFTGGNAEYLTPRSINCNDTTGDCVITRYKSDTEVLVVHIGLNSSMGTRK